MSIELLKGFSKRSPVFVPNFKSSYSNIAFVLLGFVIENVTGVPYDEAVQEYIFKPLGMKRARVQKPSDCEGVIPATVNDWAYDVGVYGPYVLNPVAL